MSLGHSPVLCDYTLNSSDIDLDTPITRVEEERDLGILFTPNLKSDKHISNIIRKANNLIGFIEIFQLFRPTYVPNTLYYLNPSTS